MKLFLAMILLHLISDFIFQSDSLVVKKKAFYKGTYKKFSIKNPLLIHGLITFLLMQMLYFFFGPWHNVLLLSVLITLIHILIDHFKLIVSTKNSIREWLLFTGDQLLHLVAIFFLSGLISINYSNKYIYIFGNYSKQIGGSKIQIPSLSNQVLVIMIISILFAVVAGYIIGFILKANHMVEPVRDGNSKVMNKPKTKVGIKIGILERVLIIIFVASGEYGALGLILAGKSLARFKALDEKDFSEYYLFGTLLSFIFGIVGGLLVKLLI